MMRLFLKVHNRGERFPLSQRFGKCGQGHFISTKGILEENSEEMVHRSGLDILEKLSPQMLSSAVLGNVYFHVTRWCVGLVIVRFFLQMGHMNPRVYSLEFGSTRISQQYPVGAFLVRLKGGVIFNKQDLQIARHCA